MMDAQYMHALVSRLTDISMEADQGGERIDEVTGALAGVFLATAQRSEDYEMHLHAMLSRILTELAINGWIIPHEGIEPGRKPS